MKVHYQELSASQMAESDAVYDALRFPRTDRASSRMLGVRSNGPLVGLGRLVDLGEHSGRRLILLGGLWVASEMRRRGIATGILRRIAVWKPDGAELWCTPNEEMVEVYEDEGFDPVDPADCPAPVAAHRAECERAQGRTVLVARWRT